MAGSTDVNRTRTQIAFAVIVVGLIGIVAVSCVALISASNKDETSRLIFASILPLIGTWVGAVLAFYFSRDNLQAASATTLDAIRAAGGLTSETLVSAAMIPVNRINPVRTVADDPGARGLLLSDIYTSMKTSGQARVPILTNSGITLYVIHEADLDKYAQSKSLNAMAFTTETVADLLADPSIMPQLTSFVTVAINGTLSDARARLAKVANAKDVFVTDNGDKEGVVLGWLTNSDLARAR